MKNPRAITMVAVSLLLGLFAVIVASNWITRQTNASAAKVIVARTDIDLGTKLNTDVLTSADWPSSNIPPGAFQDIKQLEDRVLKSSVARGEPILAAKLAPAGTKGGLSALVTEGKRAMTVRVNDVVGVAGFALPGNFVDIVVNTTETGGKQSSEQSISKIVLEHILVLAVAQEVSHDETKPKVVDAVTLEVTPAQAEKLDLARSVGTLSLVLRNQVDPSPTQTSGATKQALLGTVQASVPEPATAPVPQPEAAPKANPVHTPRPVAKSAPHSADCVEIVQSTGRSVQCF